MKDRKTVVVRPIRWDCLRTDEAEREIQRRLAIADPFVRIHAFERAALREEQGRLNAVDMMNILRTGDIYKAPESHEEGWVVTIEKRMPGTRLAGVVTLIAHPGDDLEVWTVQWMDWL